jgi:subtilase family serine protease
MSQSRIIRRSLIAFSAAFFALLGTLAAAGPSQASLPAPAPMVSLTASLAPPVPSGTTRLGALAPDTKLSIEVALNIPEQAALTAFLTGLSDPGSPDFQHFLRPGQFGPMFGPSLAQVAAVENALKSAGLSPGQVSANRLAIPVTASASAIERAFGITLEGYRLAGGREAFANTAAPRLPAAVASLVQGVLGLDDLYQVQHLSSGPLPAAPLVSKAAGKTAGSVHSASGTGPQPCSAAAGTANTANTVAAHYGLTLAYLMNDFGKGAKVGVLELEPNLASDINAYESCYDVHPKLSYIHIDGGAGSGAGSGEAALDIEMVAGLAPQAEIDVYQAPNTGGGPGEGDYDIFKKFVTSDTDKVLSDSWGLCEAEAVAANVKAQESLFEQANAQGQTIFAAAGDQGSTACYDPNASTADDTLSALSPASAPYVIGVGGTSFSGSGSSQQEVVWNDSNSLLGTGATGGGVSSIWCMPNYQHQTKIPGIVSAHSRKDTSSSCPAKYYREVPDISADGDPVYGYAVYYEGSWQLGGFGGTSAAAPVWASIAALTDASPFCAAYGAKGATLPQNLYNAVATYHSYVYSSNPQVVRDVTSGNNDYTPSGYTGGLYPATKGYDMASGLGVPMVSGLKNHAWYVYLAGLTQVLCHQAATKLKTVKVTSVSPNHGPAGKKIKVTVRGSGFLPISFADEAQILSGSKVLATVDASCTTTACTLTLPAESARTVDIKIFAESLWSSARSVKDHFTYRRT